jgi:hypothetical protein
MPGAQCTRSLVCEVVVQDVHEYSQRSHRKSPGIPARNGFTAYVVLSPAIGLSCHRRLRKSLPANLTPASRRQDHTILPSASKALSSEAPLAATASSPASVTIAIRPFSGVDGGGYKLICGFGKPEYFFKRDWTVQITLIRLRKLDFTRKSVGRAGRDICLPFSSLATSPFPPISLPSFYFPRRSNEAGPGVPYLAALAPRCIFPSHR